MKQVYLDNAATTPMSSEVIDVMVDKMQNVYGNASTGYGLGREASMVMEVARRALAKSINAKETEIIFTSGGTESDNTAIFQTARSRAKLGKHIITTAIEHEAILQPLETLKQEAFEVTYLPVDEQGNISIDDFKNALRDDTILVSIMMGNNEVGSRMPIHEIGEILKNHQAWFHTDAVQTYGLLDIDVKADHIDMLSTSAHKINGPKMMGFLYKSNQTNFPSFIQGGEQETKRRAGTENVPGIAAFQKAVEALTSETKAARQTKYFGFKQQIINGLKANDVNFEINGELNENSLNHVFNIWIPGISTYIMQTNLDLAGFAVSGGSACTAGSLEPSHVLTAMFGEDSQRISESIRISFGRYTTEQEITDFIEALSSIYQRLTK
jgi:cysteine desulfurase